MKHAEKCLNSSGEGCKRQTQVKGGPSAGVFTVFLVQRIPETLIDLQNNYYLDHNILDHRRIDPLIG